MKYTCRNRVREKAGRIRIFFLKKKNCEMTTITLYSIHQLIFFMRIFRCTGVYSFKSFITRCILFCIFSATQYITLKAFLFPLYNENTKSTTIVFWIFIIIWSNISILWIWSYIVASWMDAGSVENELYYMGFLDKHGNMKPNVQFTPEIDRIPRCDKCHLPKPFRTHHCSQCDKCYFRFDHHCDMIGNCVALKNMKAFMLFIFYSSSLWLLSPILSIIAYCMVKSVSVGFVVFCCLAGFLLGLSILIFGVLYIPEVCLNNRTTLEKIAGNAPKEFNAGVKRNIEQVFGECPLCWAFPTRITMNGFLWSSVSDSDSQTSSKLNPIIIHNNTDDKTSPLLMQADSFHDQNAT